MDISTAWFSKSVQKYNYSLKHNSVPKVPFDPDIFKLNLETNRETN